MARNVTGTTTAIVTSGVTKLRTTSGVTRSTRRSTCDWKYTARMVGMTADR